MSLMFHLNFDVYVRLPEFRAFQVALVVKNPLSNAGDIRDVGSIPGSGRSPGGGHGNPLQYALCPWDHRDRSQLNRLSTMCTNSLFKFTKTFCHEFILNFIRTFLFFWITFEMSI